MVLGPCTFSVDEYQCSCRAGETIATGTLDDTSNCRKCLHPIAAHKDFPEQVPAPKPETDIPRDSPEYTPRTRTVTKLAELLDRQRVVHVRGIPSSGKTTLSQFLSSHLKSRGETVYSMPMWSTNRLALDQVMSLCLPPEHRSETNLMRLPVVVIIDEAQYSYSDSRLWYVVIKSVLGSSTGIRICLLSSYGSPSTGAPENDYPRDITPPILGPSERVTLTVSTEFGAPDICLFYSVEEFTDAVDRFCIFSARNEFTLHADLRKYIFKLSNGHPGVVFSLLRYVHVVRAT